jgi:glycosyltransferase involved in cell wall biosynthesis
MTPLFSVIVATYNRGRHILPTITSILQQTLEEHEIIVVGDACTDETETVVRSVADDRIVWRNLPQRARSQSMPNNAGIALARGRYIAYVGHDDLWSPEHLQTLARCFVRHPEASFAVGGCIFYGPPGSGRYHVHGLFEDEQAPRYHFFPPSSIAHRREVPEIIAPGGGRKR